MYYKFRIYLIIILKNILNSFNKILKKNRNTPYNQYTRLLINLIWKDEKSNVSPITILSILQFIWTSSKIL